jgi:hypothetical protein
MNSQFPQHHLLKRLSYLQHSFWLLCQKSDGYSRMDLFLDLEFYAFGLCVCFCASAMQFLLLWL